MVNRYNNLPKDRWLIQESLKRIPQGAEFFMEWVRQNRDEFDQLFFNFLRKMKEFAEGEQNTTQLKALIFLEKCFAKMFDIEQMTGPIAVTDDNYRNLWEQALEDLKTDNHRAIPLLEALSIYFSGRPQSPYLFSVSSNLGVAYIRKNRFEKAIQHFEKALTESKDKDSESYEKVVANLANAYRQTGQFQKSLENYQHALKVAEQRKDILCQVDYLSSIAVVYLDLKDIKAALAAQEQSVKFAEASRETKLYCDSLTRLGILYASIGEKELAEKICKRALALTNESTGLE